MQLNRTFSIRLISVDLDGTLHRSDGMPAPESVQQLQAARRAGLRVVISTTRNAGSVHSLCAQMGLSDPLICTNGAEILATPEGPIWASYTIPMVVARSVAQLADRKGWEISTSVGNRSFFRQRPGQALGLVGFGSSTRKRSVQSPTQLVVVPTNEEALVAEPKRMLLHEPEAIAAAKELVAQFSQKCRTETYYRADGRLHSLCILPRNADKGTALRFVARKLEIPLEQVLAIGDNPNDVPMFEAAGVSVAMGNAPFEVRAAATVVGPSNDKEGVAWAIRRFVLQGPA